MKTIEAQWQELSRTVLAHVGDIQRKESRRMFYSGFLSCLITSGEIADACKENDDVGATMLKKLFDECHTFMKDVEQGRA
jgi:hypothetical protein